MEQINSLFENLLNIGLGVAVAVSAFFVMWGAFLYMSAAGSPRQMEQGKVAIVNALAGLAIVLLTVPGWIMKVGPAGERGIGMAFGPWVRQVRVALAMMAMRSPAPTRVPMITFSRADADNKPALG